MGTSSGSKRTASITDVPVAILLSIRRDGGIDSANENNQQLSIDADFNYLVFTETKSSEIQVGTKNISMSSEVRKKRW